MHNDNNRRQSVVFRNNLFGGLEIKAGAQQTSAERAQSTNRDDKQQHNARRAVKKLDAMHRHTSKVKLCSYTPRGHIAELLVVLSERDSIIAVTAAIIPGSQGGFKFYKLDIHGQPVKPVTADKNMLIAHLDSHHLHDSQTGKNNGRWAVIRVAKRHKMQPFGCYMFYELETSAPAPGGNHLMHRKHFVYTGKYYSTPAFEVPAALWYYEDLLHKLGHFMGLKSAISCNSLRKYYQYKELDLGTFMELYSYAPDAAPANDTRLSLREEVAEDTTHIRTMAEDLADLPQRATVSA